MSDKPIHYEPHPVSSARKAELVASGVRIVDAIYAPKGEPVEIVGAEKTRPDGAEAGVQIDGQGLAPVAEKSVADLKAELTAKGIPFKGNASRATLIALLISN